MRDTIEFIGIGLSLVALGIGVPLTVRRARLGRLAGIIESGTWQESKKATAAAANQLHVKIPRFTDDRGEIVLEQIELHRERDLILAELILGAAVLLAFAALMGLLADAVDIEHGLGRIGYDLVIALVLGGLTGTTAGIVADHLIKRRQESRWLRVRNLYYSSISAILDGLLNKAVPDVFQAKDRKVSESKTYTDVTRNFEPTQKDIFGGVNMEWILIVRGLLDYISPTKSLSSEPLLLIEPLNEALDDLERLFQAFGPIGDPRLAKKVGSLLRNAIEFKNFSSWNFDWKDPDYGGRYSIQLIIVLRLAYELREYILDKARE